MRDLKEFVNLCPNGARKAVDELLRMSERGYVPKYYLIDGICTNLDREVNRQDYSLSSVYLRKALVDCFTTWEHWSGCIHYPIPDICREFDECSAMAYALTPAWDDKYEYVGLRRDLAKHCAREFIRYL